MQQGCISHLASVAAPGCSPGLGVEPLERLGLHGHGRVLRQPAVAERTPRGRQELVQAPGTRTGVDGAGVAARFPRDDALLVAGPGRAGGSEDVTGGRLAVPVTGGDVPAAVAAVTVPFTGLMPDVPDMNVAVAGGCPGWPSERHGGDRGGCGGGREIAGTRCSESGTQCSECGLRCAPDICILCWQGCRAGICFARAAPVSGTSTTDHNNGVTRLSAESAVRHAKTRGSA